MYFHSIEPGFDAEFAEKFLDGSYCTLADLILIQDRALETNFLSFI